MPDLRKPITPEERGLLHIRQSKTADTRSCDFANVSKDTLCDSSEQHIEDVRLGCEFFAQMIRKAGENHDWDKLTNLDGFHHDFVGGFKETTWWDEHRRINRHHLLQEDGVPEDVNLVDVLEMIVDCVMAGKARTGEVYPLELSTEVLERAFKNTTEMFTQQVVVEDAEKEVKQAAN